MAYTAVNLPLTGAGDATAAPAVDLIGGLAWQGVKLFDGTEGSTLAMVAKTSAPNSSDPGLLVRTIGGGGSTVVSLSSDITVTVGNPTTLADVNLTSAGSTRLVGKVDVNNPTTAVSLSSVHTVTVGNPTTAVEANLSTVGSTRLVGRVDVNNPTTSVSLSSQITITVGNPTTQVNVTSGVVLGAGSSGNVLGAVAQGNGSTTGAPWYVISSGGGAGSTVVDVTSGVILGAGSSGNIIGSVGQGPGSSANYWFSQPLAFTSALTSRSSVATSVDVQIVAGTSARLAMVVANRSTLQTVGIGFSTAAVTTGLANVDIFIPPSGYITFGYSGGVPLYRGPLRAINLTSTAVAGSVAVTQFLSS